MSSEKMRIKKPRRSVPSDAFKQCPRCEAKNLIRFTGEAFCSKCDWHSIEATFEKIGMYAFALDGELSVDGVASPDHLDEDAFIAGNPMNRATGSRIA